MSDTHQTSNDPVEGRLRKLHLGVLLAVAACAVFSGLQPAAESTRGPDPTPTTVAVGLGLATVLLRRSASSPVVSPSTRFALSLCTWACALGLALLGCLLAYRDGQTQTGVVFALAAGIFCIRRPTPVGRRA